jgi:hypothetical protein
MICEQETPFDFEGVEFGAALTKITMGVLQNGEAGEVRTPDLEFRKLLLYPSELQPH